MDINSAFNAVGEALEQGKSDISSSVKSQLGLKVEPMASSRDSVQKEEDRQRTEQMVREFYGPSEENTGSETLVNPRENTPDELARVREELSGIINPAQKKQRQELHNEIYFEPTFNPPQTPHEERNTVDEKKNELPPLAEPSTKPKRGMIAVARRKLSSEARDVNGQG